MRRFCLFITLCFVANLSFTQFFSEDEQFQIDSINEHLNNPLAHDTTLARAFVDLSEILGIGNPDTIVILCNKSINTIDNYNTKLLSQEVNASFQKSLSMAYNNIGYVYDITGDLDSALTYYFKSLKIKESLGFKQGAAYSYNNIGFVYHLQGKVSESIKYYKKSLEIRKELNDQYGIATSLSNLGLVYQNQGDILLALDYFHQSLKISEEINDKQSIANAMNNLASIYESQEDIEKSIEYNHKSLKLYKEIGDDYGIVMVLNNLGVNNKTLGNLEKAFSYFLEGVKLQEEIGDIQGLANTLYNLGTIYEKQGDTLKTLEYYIKSIEYDEEVGNPAGIAATSSSIGTLYLAKGNVSEAQFYAKRSLKLSQELGYPNEIKYAAKLLSDIYASQEKGMDALTMYQLFISMRDSIKNEENTKATAQQQAKYKYEQQKNIDDANHEKLIAIEKEEKEKQKILIVASISILVLVIVFLVFVFNRLRTTRKQKLIIEEQKEVVELAHHELEEKNQEIMDSISYAKRIQSAILPSNKLVKEYLEKSFIFYKPKDIVAGDFYWMEHIDNKILFAAADCTGHGVPGAMVSVVCNNALNRAVREHLLCDPGAILDKTREIVINEFEKSDEDVKDGMDIALCSIKFCSEKKCATLQYAGANNPLWIIRNNEIIETKANKEPIGKFDYKTAYTTHTFELQKDDTLYIFSDGYIDQFGGEKGKKLKAKALKKILLSIQNTTMEEQAIFLENAFDNWKGDLEQIDDVCVIGVRI